MGPLGLEDRCGNKEIKKAWWHILPTLTGAFKSTSGAASDTELSAEPAKAALAHKMCITANSTYLMLTGLRKDPMD